MVIVVMKSTAWLVALSADLEGQNLSHRCCLLSRVGRSSLDAKGQLMLGRKEMGLTPAP